MRIIIIDGYGFVFRAYYSLPPLSREDGTPIGAVYGFINMLLKFLNQYYNDHIVIALDSGKKGLRHAVYPEYKANRQTPPADLIPQFSIIRQTAEAFNIRVLQQEGVEADDLIASYSCYARQQGAEVMIVSADKDLLQLLQPGIEIYDPMRNVKLDDDYVWTKFGVKAAQIADYLALVGDASDNIPGVAGIGAKAASQLLQQYGSLDNIYQNLEDIMPLRRKQLLSAGKEQAKLSQKLVYLHQDLPCPYTVEELTIPDLSSAALHNFLCEQGFHSLLKRLPKQKALSSATPASVLSTVAELQALIPAIYCSDGLALLCQDDSIAIAFGDNSYVLKSRPQKAGLLPDYTPTQQQWLEVLLPLWQDAGLLKICHDSQTLNKYFNSCQHWHNVADLSTMAYCLETGHQDYSLQSIVTRLGMDSSVLETPTLLAAYRLLLQQLVARRALSLYYTVDRPLKPILVQMEHKGIAIDTARLAALSKQFKAQLQQISAGIYQEVGEEFNIASPKQLSEILFIKMRLPSGKVGKSGAFVTDADYLEELSNQGFTIAAKILEWRGYAKLINTYTDQLPKFIDRNGRIHTSFLATFTTTGRLSSRDPNLQNVPARSAEGQKVRSAFIATPGCVLLSADYSQIELRLLAYMAQVPSLRNALQHGEDIHALTASQIFAVPITQVDSQLRRKAKAINFGIIYGISAFGLARNLGINTNEAADYIKLYFEQYPGIKQYMQETIAKARHQGYVTTLLGRRCLIPNINSSNRTARNFAERAAINAPLQGSNADIIKKAMALLGEELQRYLVLQIHDELLFEVPELQLSSIAQKVQKVMQQASPGDLSMPVELRAGPSWSEVTPLGV